MCSARWSMLNFLHEQRKIRGAVNVGQVFVKCSFGGGTTCHLSCKFASWHSVFSRSLWYCEIRQNQSQISLPYRLQKYYSRTCSCSFPHATSSEIFVKIFALWGHRCSSAHRLFTAPHTGLDLGPYPRAGQSDSWRIFTFGAKKAVEEEGNWQECGISTKVKAAWGSTRLLLPWVITWRSRLTLALEARTALMSFDWEHVSMFQ